MMLYGFVSSVANAIFSGTMSELNNKSVETYRSATVLKILKNIGKYWKGVGDHKLSGDV